MTEECIFLNKMKSSKIYVENLDFLIFLPISCFLVNKTKAKKR